MKSKLMLVSAFITAVILVLAGGVTSVVLANKNANAQALQAAQQREEQYKQAIDQANQQIERANQNLLTLQSQLQASPQPVVANAPAAPAPSAKLTPAQAAEAAQKIVEAGERVLKDPELVDYQSKVAYEVSFSKGNIYIDAITGEVLFNGTVPPVIDANQAAQIAGDYLNDHNILQVDQVPFRGTQLWRVIFKNGTMAYLDQSGQITYIQPKESKLIVEQNSGGSHSGSSGESSHEYEHESEHD